MNRSELREHIFRMLFRVEFHDAAEYDEQMTFYIEALAEPSEKDTAYMLEKTAKIIDQIPKIDAALNEKVQGWSTRRMGCAELTILRLALYEMLDDDDIPKGVAINEAVELAKRYGSEDAPSFVNGVLARFV